MVELGQDLHLPHHLLAAVLQARQADPLDGVVALVDPVLGLEHDAEPAPAQTLHRLEVLQSGDCQLCLDRVYASH